MHYLNYIIFRGFAGLIGLIPFWLLYRFSNFLSFLLLSVFKYRKDVVTRNLKNSFPNLENKALEQLIKKSYTNLADVLIEGIKGFTLSEKEVCKRYTFLNPELVNQYFAQDKHVIAYASHYGNWEWGPLAIGHQIKHRTLGIVKLLKNPYLNDYLQRSRCAKNVFVADLGKTKVSIEEYQDKPTLFVFISDQGPRNVQKAHWVNFLNQDTPCLYGADQLARAKNWPVVNVVTKRVKRGYYELKFELLTDHPAMMQAGEITAMYMAQLEGQILDQPENWLWSHRRWKRAHQK